jgi:thymidylate synthase (FAD)
MRAELIMHMGDDLTVVNAARVSFNKQRETLDDADLRLIRYLAQNAHWTPFAHPQVTMRETVPVFVARQRFKHTVGFVYNEVSRRYVDDVPAVHFPVEWRQRPAGGIKQGSGDPLQDDLQVRHLYATAVSNSMHAYAELCRAGVAPEMARMVLPQATHTSYWVTGSLAAWARAYNQRIDPHAQQEIRQLAKEWDAIIAPLFPQSWAALTAAARG